MAERVFLVADTHFGHENIIKYTKRPFPDADTMTTKLIQKWNSVVSKNDTVFLLGDFSMYSKDHCVEICSKLNGKITLIMGNHDDRSIQFYRDCGFVMVSKYPIIYDDIWILSHEPLNLPADSPFKNIFGHVHIDPEIPTVTQNSYCVSIERTGYAPIDFEEIKLQIAQFSQREQQS